MRLRSTIPAAAMGALAAAALAAGCGDDDESGTEGSPSRTDAARTAPERRFEGAPGPQCGPVQDRPTKDTLRKTVTRTLDDPSFADCKKAIAWAQRYDPRPRGVRCQRADCDWQIDGVKYTTRPAHREYFDGFWAVFEWIREDAKWVLAVGYYPPTP